MMRTVQRAECEEGMPPESTIARMSHTPCLILFVKICSAPHSLACLSHWQHGWHITTRAHVHAPHNAQLVQSVHALQPRYGTSQAVMLPEGEGYLQGLC